MKQIENIFSKTPTIKEEICPNQKTPIIVDTREKQSLISANLLEKKANIKYEKLEIGDYLIQDIVIERKTFSDFISSIINKRLFSQLQEIKKYPKHFLIIEGSFYQYEKFNVHENAIRGMLLSVAIDYQIPTIFTKDEQDTANFLILTAKRFSRPRPILPTRPTKTQKTIEKQKQFILEGFPGIGPTIAKDLLKRFSTLKELFNSNSDNLKNIKKFDYKKIQNFLGIINNPKTGG